MLLMLLRPLGPLRHRLLRTEMYGFLSLRLFVDQIVDVDPEYGVGCLFGCRGRW